MNREENSTLIVALLMMTTQHAHDKEVVITIAIDIGKIDAHGINARVTQSQAGDGPKLAFAGVDPDAPESVRLAVAVANSSAMRFHGLLTHAGHSYNSRNPEEIRKVASQETESLTRLRGRIAEQGVDKLIRSIGSTPTTSIVETFTDADEVRPGNYVFYDAFQARIGACTLSQCAVSVLATVIGSYPQHGHLLVDAGALALSKDPGPDHIDRECGFGVVCDVELSPVSAKLTVLSQEHGKIQAEPGRLV